MSDAEEAEKRVRAALGLYCNRKRGLCWYCHIPVLPGEICRKEKQLQCLKCRLEEIVNNDAVAAVPGHALVEQALLWKLIRRQRGVYVEKLFRFRSEGGNSFGAGR